jgi:hypothetical protein
MFECPSHGCHTNQFVVAMLVFNLFAKVRFFVSWSHTSTQKDKHLNAWLIKTPFCNTASSVWPFSYPTSCLWTWVVLGACGVSQIWETPCFLVAVVGAIISAMAAAMLAQV